MYTSFPITSQLFGPSLKNLFTGFILLSTYIATVSSRLSKMMHHQEHSPQAKQNLLRFLRIYILTCTIESSVKYFQDLEVHLYKKRNGRLTSSLVYPKALLNQWKCEQCTNKKMFEPVCHNRNCSIGFLPVYISRGCCWICQLCYPGFVKSNEGQHLCSKCPTNTIRKKTPNQMVKIPISVFYYQWFPTTYSYCIVRNRNCLHFLLSGSVSVL